MGGAHTLELLLVSAVDRAELVLAVLLGLVAALVASAARTAQPTSWSVRASWVRWLALLPLSVLRDAGAVARAALMGSSGTWRRVPVAGAAGDTARARAARSVAGLVLSASPGTVVVDVDPDAGTALVHALGSTRGSALERAVAP